MENELKDKDIRKILKDYLESNGYIKDEMRISEGFVRADIAVINNDHLIGFEIKSDKDNLKRLPTQSYMYNKYFRKNYVVTTKKYITKCIEIIPDEWGILLVEENSISTIREAEDNYEISYIALLQLLKVPEIKKLVTLLGTKCSNRSKPNLIGEIISIKEALGLEETLIKEITCLILKVRFKNGL